MDCSPAGSSVHGDSPGKNTGVGCHSLLQGLFPTHELNLDLTVWATGEDLIARNHSPKSHTCCLLLYLFRTVLRVIWEIISWITILRWTQTKFSISFLDWLLIIFVCVDSFLCKMFRRLNEHRGKVLRLVPGSSDALHTSAITWAVTASLAQSCVKEPSSKQCGCRIR